MPDIDYVLNKLARSKFRSSFKLKREDMDYIEKKGLDTIRSHAYDFLNKKIRHKLANDGKQTPTHGHPVFKAEHATATCCRGCIAKWYRFPDTRDLRDEEIDYLVEVIMKWIERQMKEEGKNRNEV